MVPKAGSCSRASQTMRAPARSTPGTLTESVRGAATGTTVVGTTIVAALAVQALVALLVRPARRAVESMLRAWFTVMNSVVTFQVSLQRS